MCGQNPNLSSVVVVVIVTSVDLFDVIPICGSRHCDILIDANRHVVYVGMVEAHLEQLGANVD